MTPHLPTVQHGHLQSSNSTASIFLGGVRRSWMDNPALSRPAAIPSPSTSSPATTAATVSVRPGMSQSLCLPRASSPSTGRDRQTLPQHDAHSPLQPPPQPHPPQSPSPSQPQPHPPTHSQPPSTVASPVVAGPSPSSRHPAAPDPPPPPVTSIDLPPPPIPPAQPSPTAEPSLSHLQVSSARPRESPSSVASPSHPAGPTLQGHAVPTPPPTRTSAGEAGESSRSPLSHAEMQMDSGGNPPQGHPQSVPTGHAHPDAAARPLPGAEAARQEPQRRLPFVPTVDAAFFKQSMANLTNYNAYLERTGYRRETFEVARVQLLTEACANQDCLYLAIHQVYCLHSFAPADFYKLPGFTEQQARGLSVVEKVMVPNCQVSRDFLRWSAHFPGPILVLMQTPAYQLAVQKAAWCLRQFADHWKPYIEHVFLRGFPPFAAELIDGFGLASPSLAYTIFLSTSRQLLGSVDEPAFKRVWMQDLLNYQRRQQRDRVGNPVPQAQLRQENADVIRLYQSIPASNGPARLQQQQQQQPPPTGQPAVQPHPAVPRPTVSTTASAVMRPTGIPSPQPSQSPQMPVTGPPVTASPRMATVPSNAPPLPAQAPRRRGRPRRDGVQPPPAMTTMAPGSAGVSPQLGLPLQQTVFPSQLVQSFSSRPASSATQPPPPMAAQPQIPTGMWPNGVPSPGPRALPSPQHPACPAHPAQPAQPAQPAHPQYPPQYRPPPQPQPHLRPAAPAAQPLLPPAGHKRSTTVRPHPLRDALHQAHLRGPVNEVQAPQHEQALGLFQYVSGFAVKPVPLGTEACAFTWQFALSRSDLDRVPASRLPALGQRAVRAYKDGSQIHRLRCIRVKPAATEVSEPAWCTAESIWPSVIYVFINDVEAYVRRKVHNGKDLPLDISHYLREGVNTVSIHFLRTTAESRDLTYAMAVEVLDIAGFSRAKGLAQAQAAAESRQQIRARLAPGPQDDEVSIVSDNLTIDLVDPFMATVFHTPVRGRFCGHRECFDHDTWIMTRASKSGTTPLKEDWKCPICQQDARPQSLVVDGFLVDVREELARTNRLETARAIQVKADGSWQVRAETEASDRSGPDRTAAKRKLNGVNNPESPASQKPKVEQGPSAATNGDASARPTRQQTPEVIALD